MTIGKKLMLGSGSFLALSIVLSVSSLYTTESLGSELSNTASVTARSVELAGAAASEASAMLSAERGLLLRLALGDSGSATTLHANFAEAANMLNRDLSLLKGITGTSEGRSADAAMSKAVSGWIPADREMWQLCGRQDYQSAFRVFDEKVTPEANRVQAAARTILDLEHRTLEQEKARAVVLPAQSRWIAI